MDSAISDSSQLWAAVVTHFLQIPLNVSSFLELSLGTQEGEVCCIPFFEEQLVRCQYCLFGKAVANPGQKDILRMKS